MSTNKASSRKRFPLGGLAQQRKILKDNYVAQNAKVVELTNDLKNVEKDVEKISKRVCNHLLFNFLIMHLSI